MTDRTRKAGDRPTGEDRKHPSDVTGEAQRKRADLAQREMGDNALQGNDQENVHNQRLAQPDARTSADDVIESFEKLDKDTRARRDLDKGAK